MKTDNPSPRNHTIGIRHLDAPTLDNQFYCPKNAKLIELPISKSPLNWRLIVEESSAVLSIDPIGDNLLVKSFYSKLFSTLSAG